MNNKTKNISSIVGVLVGISALIAFGIENNPVVMASEFEAYKKESDQKFIRLDRMYRLQLIERLVHLEYKVRKGTADSNDRVEIQEIKLELQALEKLLTSIRDITHPFPATNSEV